MNGRTLPAHCQAQPGWPWQTARVASLLQAVGVPVQAALHEQPICEPHELASSKLVQETGVPPHDRNWPTFPSKQPDWELHESRPTISHAVAVP